MPLHIRYFKGILIAIIIVGFIILIVVSFQSSNTKFTSRTQTSLRTPVRRDGNLLTDEKQQFVSLCSRKADDRGLHQNVIAYSLYGNFSNPNHFQRYFSPINYTLDNVKRVYPGWIVRIYMAQESDELEINLKMREILDSYPFVDLCNVTSVLEVHGLSSRPIFQMTWRFLPLLDPTVDRLMSRDSDSLVLNREVDAVQQWLTQSNATFHVMRDNKVHNRVMLGGMWGAKIYQRRLAIKDAAMQLFKDVEHQLKKEFDQTMLKNIIWPLAIDDSLAHDSYLCQKYPGSYSFPTQRQGATFIGQVARDISVNSKPVICPENCRPKDHRDWIYC